MAVFLVKYRNDWKAEARVLMQYQQPKYTLLSSQDTPMKPCEFISNTPL